VTTDKTNNENVCYFGMIEDKGQTKSFGILDSDRSHHMYLLGKTGMGKSTMLHNMCLQDIYKGKGVCFIDAHGDSVEYILDRIPTNRQQDVIYFNPADLDYPLGLNMMQADTNEQSFLICSGLMSVFKSIWSGMWSSRMEYILSNTILALLEYPGTTMLSIVKMLSDDNYAKYIVSKVQNPLVKHFWTREYTNFHDKYRQEAIAPILNKIGQFFSNEMMRNILGQTKSSFSVRDVIDNRKILLVNLSKGRLGEDNSNLLGSLLVTKIQLAAMSRVDLPEEQRSGFYLYVDEFQNFTTDSFASILSEARKYGLNLILAHQYMDQLSETGKDNVRNAIVGNVGTWVTFQVGPRDAERIVAEFEPNCTKQQLLSLDKAEIAVKLSIYGRTSIPFFAKTIAPIFNDFGGKKDFFINLSRQRYTRRRDVVNKELSAYLADTNFDNRKSNTKFLNKK
jgi:Type IV secretion-system coupling protein DNA-binding domain